MILKASTRVEGIKPELVLALQIIERKFDQLRTDPYQELVITSCTDGVHSGGSLHPHGYAVDLRTRDITAAQRQQLVALVRNALGAEFDVVLEPDHLHVEFDP